MARNASCCKGCKEVDPRDCFTPPPAGSTMPCCIPGGFCLDVTNDDEGRNLCRGLGGTPWKFDIDCEHFDCTPGMIHPPCPRRICVKIDCLQYCFGRCLDPHTNADPTSGDCAGSHFWYENDVEWAPLGRHIINLQRVGTPAGATECCYQIQRPRDERGEYLLTRGSGRCADNARGCAAFFTGEFPDDVNTNCYLCRDMGGPDIGIFREHTGFIEVKLRFDNYLPIADIIIRFAAALEARRQFCCNVPPPPSTIEEEVFRYSDMVRLVNGTVDVNDWRPGTPFVIQGNRHEPCAPPWCLCSRQDSDEGCENAVVTRNRAGMALCEKLGGDYCGTPWEEIPDATPREQECYCRTESLPPDGNNVVLPYTVGIVPPGLRVSVTRSND